MPLCAASCTYRGFSALWRDMLLLLHWQSTAGPVFEHYFKIPFCHVSRNPYMGLQKAQTDRLSQAVLERSQASLCQLLPVPVSLEGSVAVLMYIGSALHFF